MVDINTSNIELTDAEKDDKKYKSKLINSPAFINFIIISFMSIGTILSILYLSWLIPLFMKYPTIISIILITILGVRYFLKHIYTNNIIMKFFVDKSIIVITPLLIIYLIIIMKNATIIVNNLK